MSARAEAGTAVTLHVRAGSTAATPYELVLSPEDAGWAYSSLRVLALTPGETHTFDTGDEEAVLLPLSGAATVRVDGETFELHGRADVWSGVSDAVYLPRDARVEVRSEHGGRFALPAARCSARLGPRYLPASGVPVEVRGAGSCTRQVNGFCAADAVDADRLIAVEVLTPAGNWSSYPPHKHDAERPGEESELEEIYYFEVAAGPDGAGVAYQRVYGTEERPLDVLAEVRSGDVVLVPHGWHGPSMAAPGYDLYYLNVMAGPGERSWLTCDDPAHAWVRASWTGQAADPRVPMTAAPREESS